MLFTATVCVESSLERQCVGSCPKPRATGGRRALACSLPPLFALTPSYAISNSMLPSLSRTAFPLTPPFLFITVYLLLNVYNVMFCKLLIYIYLTLPANGGVKFV